MMNLRGGVDAEEKQCWFHFNKFHLSPRVSGSRKIWEIFHVITRFVIGLVGTLYARDLERGVEL